MCCAHHARHGFIIHIYDEFCLWKLSLISTHSALLAQNGKSFYWKFNWASLMVSRVQFFIELKWYTCAGRWMANVVLLIDMFGQRELEKVPNYGDDCTPVLCWSDSERKLCAGNLSDAVLQHTQTHRDTKNACHNKNTHSTISCCPHFIFLLLIHAAALTFHSILHSHRNINVCFRTTQLCQYVCRWSPLPSCERASVSSLLMPLPTLNVIPVRFISIRVTVVGHNSFACIYRMYLMCM